MARIRTPWLSTAAVVLAATGLVWAGLVWAGSRSGSPRLQHFAGTADYLPGVAADLYLPPGHASTTPVVVLVPGGGWQTADRRGLRPLADALAGQGMVVVNATYRAADSRARFPQPVADIVCAIDYAADRARRAGYRSGPLVVVGHSSGAHLASLAALGGSHFRGACPFPQVQPDGFVGLAGPYDITKISDLAYPLFDASPAEAPAAWREGNPLTWVTARTGAHPLRALLAAGDADAVVPPTLTTSFAAALTRAGHPVRVVIVPGATHSTIYTPRVIGGTIASWIEGWRAVGQTSSARASGTPGR